MVMTDDYVERIILRVSQVLKNEYQDTTKRLLDGIKDVQKRVNKLEENDSKQDDVIEKLIENDLKQEDEIEKLKDQIDDHDQKERDRNLIIT
jgi:uncharacterized coiled-coil protein SlyX